MRNKKVDYNDVILQNIVLEDYRNGKNTKTISKELNLCKETIVNFYRKLNIPVKKIKYNFNTNLFLDKMSSGEAWIIGWLLADGCIYGNRVKLGLKNIDKEVLYKISKVLEFDGNITLHNESATLSIYNKELVDKLKKFNLIPRKSLVLKFPSNIKDNVVRDLIRGYFEGDGCVTMNSKRNYVNIAFKGTFEFLTELRNKLYNCLGINGCLTKCKTTPKNTWDLNISGNFQALSFLNWIYDNTPNEIILNRKYNKSIDLVNKVNSKRVRNYLYYGFNKVENHEAEEL